MFETIRELEPGSVLERIVRVQREAVTRRAAERPEAQLTTDLLPSDRSFLRALSGPDLGLIAELKRSSPSQGKIRSAVDIDRVAEIYGAHAAAISVLTEARFFGGDHETLTRVRARSGLPVLMKDFVISTYQLYEGRAAGADSVLLMAAILEEPALQRLIDVARRLGMEPLVEVHDETELETVAKLSATIIGINNRDLRTLAIDTDNFHRLAPRVPPDRLLVCESGIERREDVERIRGKAHAALIGTALMAAQNIEAAIEALGW